RRDIFIDHVRLDGMEQTCAFPEAKTSGQSRGGVHTAPKGLTMHHILGGNSPCVKDSARPHLRCHSDRMPYVQRIRRKRGHHVRSAECESLLPVESGNCVLHTQRDGTAERSDTHQIVPDLWETLERIHTACLQG